MALSGLFIVIFTIYTIENKIEFLDKEIHTEALNTSIFAAKSSALLERAKELNDIIDNTIKSNNGKYQVPKGKLILKYSESELKKLISEIYSNKLQSDIELVKRAASSKRLLSLNNKNKRLLIWAILFITIGSTLACIGFIQWYIKVQKPLDQNISRE